MGKNEALCVAALAAADRGWSIIPIGREKRPTMPWKPFQRRRATAAELCKWFNGSSRLHGLAVVCGEVSGGLVCRDFDDMAAYGRWASRFPDLAKALPTVQTARGRHLYFTGPTRRIHKCGDGELRGAGYCVLPPSVHPTGVEYRWIINLPDGALMEVADPVAAGLAPNDYTEHVEQAELAEQVEQADAIKGSVDEIIACTLPTKAGERNAKSLLLARAVKFHPAYLDAQLSDLKPVVRRWYERALPVIRTKDWETTWAEFAHDWESAMLPLGDAPMNDILQHATNAEPPAAVMEYQPGVWLLACICQELQRRAGDNVFFLSCRTAARLLDTCPKTANTWLRVLIADKLLCEVSKGSAATGKASRFRYVGN